MMPLVRLLPRSMGTLSGSLCSSAARTRSRDVTAAAYLMEPEDRPRMMFFWKMM